MNEYDLIKSFAEKFPRSPEQRNELFACDSELIEIGDQLWALTIDEFSPDEDMFTSDSPAVLGANLVTATVSDLLAAGADPAFFMHAMSLPRNVAVSFVSALTDGIKPALDEADCVLLGGDMGSAETWRFCGFAMGPVPSNKALTRMFPEEAQTLWVTGEMGDANLAVLDSRPTPRFELRINESRLIRRYATACIDTSGGFLDAVWQMHALRPETHITIDLDCIPLASGIAEIVQTHGIPAEAALLGGAGEYELLFAVPTDLSSAAESELANAGAVRVGAAFPRQEPGVHLCRDGELLSVMPGPPPCPREAETVADHIRDVMCMAQSLFGSET